MKVLYLYRVVDIYYLTSALITQIFSCREINSQNKRRHVSDVNYLQFIDCTHDAVNQFKVL